MILIHLAASSLEIDIVEETVHPGLIITAGASDVMKPADSTCSANCMPPRKERSGSLNILFRQLRCAFPVSEVVFHFLRGAWRRIHVRVSRVSKSFLDAANCCSSNPLVSWIGQA